MRKIFPIILILVAAALSGCIGSKSDDIETLKFERTNLNLDAKIVDLKLLPEDVRAGEEVSADLVIANTGKENIINETIYIKAKVKTLDDFFANLALSALSDDMKSKEFTMDFQEEIRPGTNKPISAVFHTVKEMKGRNLAGIYTVTVILSVNGEKVDYRVLQFTLHSGKTRDANETQSNITSMPTPSATAMPDMTSTPAITETPTPTPTPEAVTVKPTGIVRVTRIMGYKFGEPSVTINAGDAIQWYNLDDDTMTLVEDAGKITNISVYSRKAYTFNTTGMYTFKMYYPRMRVSPPVQTIVVKLNQTQ